MLQFAPRLPVHSNQIYIISLSKVNILTFLVIIGQFLCLDLVAYQYPRAEIALTSELNFCPTRLHCLNC